MKGIYVLSTALFGLAIISQRSYAQTNERKSYHSKDVLYSIGISGPVATGKFNDTHKWGLGGILQLEVPVAKKVYGISNIGFTNFFGKEVTKNNSRYSVTDGQFLPVKMGFKYFPVGVFFVQGEAGLSFALNKGRLGYDRNVAFIYSPEVGIRLPLGENNNVDIAAIYERSTKFKIDSKDSKVNFYGLKVAYGFSL